MQRGLQAKAQRPIKWLTYFALPPVWFLLTNTKYRLSYRRFQSMTKNKSDFFTKNKNLYNKTKIIPAYLSLILTIGDKGIEKTLDKYLTMLIAFPAATIHFLAHLLKIVQGIGILIKDFIGVVFQPQIGQIH